MDDLGTADHPDPCKVLQVFQSLEIEALVKESDWIGIKKILEPVDGEFVFEGAEAPRSHVRQSINNLVGQDGLVPVPVGARQTRGGLLVPPPAIAGGRCQCSGPCIGH